MVTLRDIATRHNMDPHSLRVLLRSTGIRAQGRWEWDDNDPFLEKIEELIKRRPTVSSRSPQKKVVKEERKVPETFKVPPKQDKVKNVAVPAASRLIARLDRLAESGKYDDVALVFEYEVLIYSWENNRLSNLQWMLDRGYLPLCFMAFKWHGSHVDIRIWHSPWKSEQAFILEALDQLVYETPLPEERTALEVNQDWTTLD